VPLANFKIIIGEEVEKYDGRDNYWAQLIDMDPETRKVNVLLTVEDRPLPNPVIVLLALLFLSAQAVEAKRQRSPSQSSDEMSD
jgi:hypothetical protein